MAKIYVKIKGIHCQNCETTIQKALLKLPSVKEVTIKNFIAHITYEEPLTNDEIINAITKAGYITKASYISNNLKDLEKKSNLKQSFLILTIIILIISLTYKIFGFNIFNVIPTIDSNITYNGYQDIKVEVAKPVKMIIHVDKKYLTGCNNSLMIPEYNINQELKTGDNIIEFYPTKEGTFIYTCWMNMLKNNIKVVNKL